MGIFTQDSFHPGDIMKFVKFVLMNWLLALLLVPLTMPLDGAERAKGRTMKELTDRNSPSYVPCPFPKNRKEIIRNMQHYTTTLNKGITAFAKGYDDGGMNDVWYDLWKPGSDYKLGKIFKVKNRIYRRADDYSWIIYIMNKNGHIMMTVSMNADGNVTGEGLLTDKDYREATPEQRKRWDNFRRELTRQDLCRKLSDALGRTVERKEIKKTDRVVYSSGKISTMRNPLWEITLKDGSIYFYSIRTNMVYLLAQKEPWKLKGDTESKTKKFHNRYYALRNTPGVEAVMDTISDELITLKIVKRK